MWVFSPGTCSAEAFAEGKILDEKMSRLALSLNVLSASSGLNGTNISVVGNSVVVWQQAQLRVSGEMFLVAIMLGKRLAKSSSITSEYTPGLLSKYKPPRSVARSSQAVFVSSARFFFQGTRTPSSIAILI